jgi:hypothetical protein
MEVFVGASGTTRRTLGVTFAAALLCLLALSAGAASAAPKPLPRPVQVADDALARALAAGRLSPAEYALERARSLFRLGAVRREFGDVSRPDPHAATLILRDLALRLRELPAADRREARRLLARPSDGLADPFEDGWTVDEAPASPVCDAHICVHWVETSTDAPTLADTESPADGVPDWIENVVQPTFATVWTTEIDTMQNPAPLSDDTSPNDGGENEADPNRTKLDIYLADVGAAALFGYCTSDDPRLDGGYSYWDISAYCVVDNDFADFGPPWTPQQYLQVTAAHEFRHASQFAQDFAEDWWLVEGDAMWIEGEVFPTVTDRFDYLDTSPLARPSLSLDHGVDFHEYGAWVFFRYLSERFDDPSVMRDVWVRADGSGDSDGPGLDQVGPDQYSMQAVGNAVAARGISLPTAFATFAQWNRSPARYYEEGASYPFSPASATYRLGPGARTTGLKTRKLRHLASAYYTFKPRTNGSTTAKLRVSVDLPSLASKPAASLLLAYKSGAYSVRPIALDSAGNGARTVPFGRTTISRVDLVLTNASPRFNLSTCWQSFTTYSCGGAVALDENRAYRFSARIP